MRAWLISAVVLAGCLHGPAFPHRPDAQSQATDEWRRYMRTGEYALAAEAASKGGLDSMLVGLALEQAVQKAQRRLEEYFSDHTTSNVLLKERVLKAYAAGVSIACTYGPTKEAATMIVSEVEAAHERLSENALWYSLLDYDCPLEHNLRYNIIAAAASADEDDYALKHALHAPDWTENDALSFAITYAMSCECSRAFRIASLFSLKSESITKMIAASDCEHELHATAEWVFPQLESRSAFFSAVRLRRYHLAMTFNRLAGGGRDEIAYLVQEMFAQKDEYKITSRIYLLNPELRDAMYAYALEHARARFVGMRAKEIFWEERAFEKLLETGKYEDAAEVAEFGPSLTLRTEGVLKAFRAAVKGDDFLVVNYLWRRYDKIVPKQEYEQALAAWNKAHPDRRFGARKIPPRPKATECVPDTSGDWTVKRCD